MRSCKKEILHEKRGGLKVRSRGSKKRDQNWEESLRSVDSLVE